MRLKTTLGGVAALLMIGVFYTFALCFVEDVDDNIISEEYYYHRAETPIGGSKDDDSAELAEDGTDSDAQKVKKKNIPTVTYDDIKTPNEVIEAVPAMVTAVPVPEKNEDKPVTAVNSQTSAPDEQYPEDPDTDDYYSDSDAEAYEQSVYAVDKSESGTLLPEDDDTDEDNFPEDDDVDNDMPVETSPAVTEPPPADDGKSDIIITVWGSEQSEETTAPASAEPLADTSTSETFTAKFNGSVQTVNAYDLVCWIVNNEISESFNDEAIKAQAVAAYSYVRYHNINGLTPSVLVKKNPSNRIKSLVSEVWGVCCYYEGNVAQTVYMASSSGYTADASNVWGGSVPYLKSVACPFDAQFDPNYGTTMTVSEEKMRSLLESSLGIALSNNPYNWITIMGYIDGNYVSEVNIDGQKTISGRKMRENVFGYSLKSASFDVSYSRGTFTFTTYGYGHGVGMSQNGANILAKQGYSYTQILKYYFTGIEVL